MSIKGWVRSTIIEVFQKKTTETKYLKDKIYLNGEDNLYPNTLNALINDSPTSKRCSNLMSKYIIGEGVVNDYDISRRFTLNDFSTLISRQISVYYGACIWVGYGEDSEGKIEKNNTNIIEIRKG